MFASHIIVPVNECAVWIVSPSPHVQFEERRNAKPVRGIDELEILAFELWRSTVVSREPGGCVHDVLDPNQPPRVPYRLIYQGLRITRVQHAISDQAQVEVVNAHRAVVRAADAPK